MNKLKASVPNDAGMWGPPASPETLGREAPRSGKNNQELYSGLIRVSWKSMLFWLLVIVAFIVALSFL